jgi:Fe-S cluster biogenesis protein NfuA
MTITNTLEENILKALGEIRPFLQADGGDIELVEVIDNKHVKVALKGACMSCSVNQMTLKAGVETTIKKHAPEIETVVNI